ncbi:MAG: hypothetical protein WD689_05955 [Gaiellaceae bacterium]
MSTSPDPINVLSRWLAGHVSDDELRRAVAGVPEAAELSQALEQGGPTPQLQRLVRETLEELALG